MSNSPNGIQRKQNVLFDAAWHGRASDYHPDREGDVPHSLADIAANERATAYVGRYDARVAAAQRASVIAAGGDPDAPTKLGIVEKLRRSSEEEDS